MEQVTYIFLSFVCGMIFMRFFSWVMQLGNSAIAMKNTINDCLLVMSANMQIAIESYEIKYHALKIAERDDKYIDFQKQIDKQQLKTLQKTIVRNFILSVPSRYNHLVKFHDWDSAMSYLNEELKRRQS